MVPANRAATPQEKKLIINELFKIWLQNPDLRLTQLIMNLQEPDGVDIYYIEDFKLIEDLKEFYNYVGTII